MDWSSLFAGANLPFGSMAPGAVPGWQANYLPSDAVAQPANQADTGAAATVLPGSPGPVPVGILNGAQPQPMAPAQAQRGPNYGNMSAALDKISAMVNPKLPAPAPLAPIQMPRPVGPGAGVDPRALIAAMMGR